MDPSTVAPMAPSGDALGSQEATANGSAAVGTSAAPVAPVAVIPPLAVPWLHHDAFPTVKKVCSESGLPQAKKTSVVRVLQELKKGRNRINDQLAHLEAQLLHVSDFLSGATPTLEIATDTTGGVAEDDATSVQGDARGDASHDGKHIGEGDKVAPIDPVATLVEEDLAAETPCMTVGLWRYLSVFPFFKTVTLEDMQEALLLEDPALVVPPEASDTDDVNAVDPFTAVNRLPPLDAVPTSLATGEGDHEPSSVQEMLRMRLLASLLPAGSKKRNGFIKASDFECIKAAENGHSTDPLDQSDASMEEALNGHLSGLVKEVDVGMADAQHNGGGDEDVEMMPVEEYQLLSSEAKRASTQTLQQLRDIGLVEASTEEVTQHLTARQDDEVSSEIRMLQSELVRQVRRNNEVKRTLRRALERLKPWLTHDEEYHQIETKFQKMWHRKKELQRKKKHKEKKLQRKEASYKSAFVVPPQPPVPS